MRGFDPRDDGSNPLGATFLPVITNTNWRFLLKCDLHGFELAEAWVEILQALRECQINDDSKLEIVHGYKHGQVLKDYILSSQFIKDTTKAGFLLKKVQSVNPGTTLFSITFK
jgi:hypothetical protein